VQAILPLASGCGWEGDDTSLALFPRTDTLVPCIIRFADC